MVFDPKLQSDAAFIRPTEQPNALVSVANLFGDLMSGSKQTQPRQPSADERFASDLSEFMKNQPATAKLDRKLGRQFIQRYPQHTGQMASWMKEIGITPMDDPTQQAIEGGLTKYSSDPRFIAAGAAATNLPEAEREPFMLKTMESLAQEEAQLKVLEQDATRLTAEGTLKNKQWEAIATTQKTFSDNVVSSVLGPIFQSVKNGQAYSLTPEEKATLGVRFDTIDIKNMPMVLMETRNFLSKNFSDHYRNQFGTDGGLPPKEVEERVLASVDTLIKVTEQFDSPQEVANALDALTQTKVWEKAEASGINGTLYLLRTLPPELTVSLRTDAKFSELVGNFILDQNGNSKTPTDISKAIDAGSTNDADELARRLATYGPINKELFEAQKAALSRSGKDLVDWTTFNKIIATGSSWMGKEADNDPEFKQKTQDWFMSDINKHTALIRRNLPPGVELSYQNGRYTAIQTPVLPSGITFGGKTPIEIANERLPKGVTIDDLNSKLAALKTFKGFGQEVVDAVIEQELGTAVRGGAGQGEVKGSAGEDLLDFGAYEKEYGLPAGYLAKTAQIESGGSPKAKNPNSSAGGLFQQIDSNAKAYGVKDRFDPIQSTVGAAKFARDNLKYLSNKLGREPTAAELYLAHQQGPAGAAKLLTNPTALAKDIVGESAVRLNGGNSNMTAGEFANIWISKYAGSRGATSYTPPQEASINVDALSVQAPAEGVASGAPQEVRREPVAALGSPEVERLANELPEASPETVARIREAMKTKPVDPEIKALIEQLIGGSNAEG